MPQSTSMLVLPGGRRQLCGGGGAFKGCKDTQIHTAHIKTWLKLPTSV